MTDETDGGAIGIWPPPKPSVYRIEHDGFVGEIIGSYRRRDGKEGVVLQQIGTNVVHVYGRKWLKEVGDD